MNSDDLTQKQAKRINESLYRLTNYLVRLRKRMEQKGFPPGDELYRLTCAAHDAVCRLSNAAHYRSCNGVYRPSGKDGLEANKSD